MAFQVISRISEALSAELPVHALFDHPSAEELCRHVRAERHEPSQPPLRPVSVTSSPHGKNTTRPSFSQERLWVLEQSGSTGSAYNMPLTVEIKGIPDISTLERSINEIIRRHDALRACFPCVSGRPAQTILPEMPVPLDITDLSHLPPKDQIIESHRLISKEARYPFDLTRAPLIRTTLIKLRTSIQHQTSSILLITLLVIGNILPGTGRAL